MRTKQKIATVFFFIVVIIMIFNREVLANPLDSALSTKPDKFLQNINEKLIRKLDKQFRKEEEQMNNQTNHWLKKLQKEENKLKKKLAKTDSIRAEQIFGNVDERYTKLKNELNKKNGKVKQYIPSLDSLHTVTKFLQQNGLNANMNIDCLSQSINSVQQKMQNATNLKKHLQQRKEQLKQQLQNTPLAKQLQGVNKQIYYYNQQIKDYKELFENTDKLTDKAIGLVRENAAFKEFFNTNSRLAELFKVLQNTGGLTSLNGLQTRASVQQSLQQRIGNINLNTGGTNVLKDKIDVAKGELDKMKSQLNSGGNNIKDTDMPNFKPNSQKTKSFFKRLELGFNIQSQKNTSLLPTTSDIAATVGYKLNDKTTAGLGLAYKMGWGNGWKDISLSNQGIGIRSFIDIKLFPDAKGAWGFFTKNIWISGGYEINYLPELKDKLATISRNLLQPNYLGLAWQESALLGISKKYKSGKKTAQIQLLYNLLYKHSYPQQIPLVFRVGWGK